MTITEACRLHEVAIVLPSRDQLNAKPLRLSGGRSGNVNTSMQDGPSFFVQFEKLCLTDCNQSSAIAASGMFIAYR